MEQRSQTAQRTAEQWTELGNTAYENQQYQQAHTYYANALKREPNFIGALNGMAITCKALNKNADAIAYFDKSLAINPQNKWAWYNKGLTLHFDNYEEAIKCYDKVVELDPNNNDALTMKGQALANDGRNLEALVCYKKILSREPNNRDLLSRMSNTLVQCKDYDGAVELLERVFTLDPNDCMYLNITHPLCELGHPDKAVSACDKYILHNTEDRLAYNIKARILCDFLGHFNEALECYERFFRLLNKNNTEQMIIDDSAPISTTNVRTVEYLIAKSDALMGLGRYQDALKCYEEVLILAEKFKEVYSSKARILDLKSHALKMAGKNQEALDCLNKIESLPDNIKMGVSPSSLLAARGLIILLQNKTNLDEAENLFDESLVKYNKTSLGLVGNGLISLLKAKNSLADNYFNQAENITENLREKLVLYFLIGHYCAALGLYVHASKFFEKALKLKADYLPAMNALKKLPSITQKTESSPLPHLTTVKPTIQKNESAPSPLLTTVKPTIKKPAPPSSPLVTTTHSTLPPTPSKNLASTTLPATQKPIVLKPTAIPKMALAVPKIDNPPKDKINQSMISIVASSNEFELGIRLGEGGFGEVFKGRWQGNDVAIKKLKNRHLSDDALAEFNREAQLMSQLRHPQIVMFYKVCTELKNYAIIMEYCEKGSLYNWLQTPQSENLDIRIQIGWDIGKGLTYLHQQKILHRDLKSLNVLLDKNSAAKITDFGMSKIRTETFTATNSSGIKGTLRWTSPEVMKGKKYSEAADVYAYGLVLFELTEKKVPYADQPNEMVVGSWIAQGKKEKPTEKTPRFLAELMAKCWENKRKKRPTAKAAIEEIEAALKAGSPEVPVNTSSGFRGNLDSDQAASNFKPSRFRHNLTS